MKTFVVLMLLVITFLLLANGAFKGLDLTPASANASENSSAESAAPVAQAPQAAPQVAPQVIAIQESPTNSSNTGNPVPVTGCTNPFTVQAGDTLGQIATICNTSLAAIRQANPQITNANVIYPGQQINIPGASAAAQPAVVVPVTGNSTGEASPAATQAPAAPLIITPTVVVPVTGAYPLIAAGTGLQVKAIDYPPNTPVNIAIGPQNQGYTLAANGVTDASGNFTTHVTVPQSQNAQTLYVVVVATTGASPVQAMSQPFYVGPAASSNH